MTITDQKFIETIMFDSSIAQSVRSTFIAKILADARYHPILELFVKELCNNSLDIPEIKSIYDACMKKVPLGFGGFVKPYIYKGNDVVLYENVVKSCLLEQFSVPKVVRSFSNSILTSVQIKEKLKDMLCEHILPKILCAKIGKENWDSLESNNQELHVQNLLTMIVVAVNNTAALQKDTRLISDDSKFTDELALVSEALGGLTDEEIDSSSDSSSVSYSSYKSCVEIMSGDCLTVTSSNDEDNISVISTTKEDNLPDFREFDDNSVFINNISLALGVVIMVVAIMLLSFTSIGLLNCSLVVMSATLPVLMMRERYSVDNFKIKNPVKGSFKPDGSTNVSRELETGDYKNSLNISLSNK